MGKGGGGRSAPPSALQLTEEEHRESDLTGSVL